MATSTLTSLPTELLHEIIPHTLPEGFEGLALTCRRLYILCTPFIERHNQRRKRLCEFTYCRYYPNKAGGLLSNFNPPAVWLIQQIAHEPIVARYIRHADFTYDTWPPRPRADEHLPDADLGGPVVAIFAESPYLRAAGLDWREFYARIQEDLEGEGRYSQHAAAFLLTLLPNVTSLKLPCLWRPCEMAEQLIHAIARRAVDTPGPSGSLWDRPSLAQVTEFEPYSESAPAGRRIDRFSEPGHSGHRFNLADVLPFLALPKLRSFRTRSCVVGDSASAVTTYEDAGFPPAETLEAAHFDCSFLDEVAMTTFLRRTLNLKELTYSHCVMEHTTQDWDVCRFVRAIEREAGGNLETLEVQDLVRGSLYTGGLSMRGFQRLRKLHLPLEIAACNLATDASARDREPTDKELRGLQRLTDILVPASVSELSLHSVDPDRNVTALRVMFCDFAARKAGWVPALEKLRLSPRPKKDGAYKDAVGKLEVEMEEAGVMLHLRLFPDEGEGEEWEELEEE